MAIGAGAGPGTATLRYRRSMVLARALVLAVAAAAATPAPDPRNILSGIIIAPAGGFYDMVTPTPPTQPLADPAAVGLTCCRACHLALQSNILAVNGTTNTSDTRLMMTMRHSTNKEGGIGEQEFSSWSDAGGAADSWSPLVPLEPEQMKIRDEWRIPSHTSTLVPSTTKLSRVHAIYMWNGRNITTLPSGERCSRNDDMGGFALKFTDDGGASWSAQRWPVPLRVTAIDRDNTYAGKVALIYGGSRHLHVGGQTYIPFNKFRYCCAETNVSEAFALVSDNIATAATPAEIRWRLLPSGERGLGVPGGGEGVAEEAHMLQVGNSSSRLLMLYRSARGMLGSAYSSDGGSSFEAPQWLPYDANAATPRVVKNPRGSFTPFRSTTDPSLYLMIYYNNAIGSTSYGTR